MANNVKQPLRLTPGDTIGVAAPASCFEQQEFQDGISLIANLGFKIRTPESTFERRGYLAGTDSLRAGAFMDLWTDPDVGAVMCARGGYGAMRVLPLLDYKEIYQND